VISLEIKNDFAASYVLLVDVHKLPCKLSYLKSLLIDSQLIMLKHTAGILIEDTSNERFLSFIETSRCSGLWRSLSRTIKHEHRHLLHCIKYLCLWRTPFL